MGDEDIRIALAGVIRDNRELIAQRLERCYVEQYPHSRANQMNAADIHEWTLSEISDIASAIENDDVTGRTYENIYGDMLVDTNNPELTPFVNCLANIQFEARIIAPVIYSATLRDVAFGNRLVGCYEDHVQKVVAENCRLYTEQISRPRALSRTWDLMSGMTPSEDYEDTPAKRYLGKDGQVQEAPAMPEVAQPVCDTISPREQQVLNLLMEGKTNGEIASALGIRQNTVKNHVSRIFDKYNVNTRTELIVRVLGR